MPRRDFAGTGSGRHLCSLCPLKGLGRCREAAPKPSELLRVSGWWVFATARRERGRPLLSAPAPTHCLAGLEHLRRGRLYMPCHAIPCHARMSIPSMKRHTIHLTIPDERPHRHLPGEASEKTSNYTHWLRCGPFNFSFLLFLLQLSEHQEIARVCLYFWPLPLCNTEPAQEQKAQVCPLWLESGVQSS